MIKVRISTSVSYSLEEGVRDSSEQGLIETVRSKNIQMEPGKISPELIKMVENVVGNMRVNSPRIPVPPPPPHSSPSFSSPSPASPIDLGSMVDAVSRLLESEQGVALKGLMMSGLSQMNQGMLPKDLINNLTQPKPVYCEEKGSAEESSPKSSEKKESISDVIGAVSPLIKSVMDQMKEDKKKDEEKTKITSSALTSCLMDCCRMGMESDNKKLQAFCFIEKISLFSKMYLTAMTMEQTLSSDAINTLRTELNSQFSNVLTQLNPCLSSLPHPD